MKNRQINLYLTKNEICRIEKYLKENGYLFASEFLTNGKVDYDDILMRDHEMSKSVLLPDAKIYTKTSGKKIQTDCNLSEIIEFSYFGTRENVMRIRFFYVPAALTDKGFEVKSEQFLKMNDRFFRFLRRRFVKYTDFPSVYKEKALDLREAF